MIEKGIYLHYKGGVYEVVGNAEHTETNEELVLYRDIKNPNGKIWARPAKMWDDIVDGKKRFQKLDIEHVPENYDGVLISRQAAIDVVKESHECGWYLMETISHIEELPTVDAVEVVRCRDCKHLSNDRITPEFNRVCRLYGCGKKEYGFCDEGERRTDE